MYTLRKKRLLLHWYKYSFLTRYRIKGSENWRLTYKNMHISFMYINCTMIFVCYLIKQVNLRDSCFCFGHSENKSYSINSSVQSKCETFWGFFLLSCIKLFSKCVTGTEYLRLFCPHNIFIFFWKVKVILLFSE